MKRLIPFIAILLCPLYGLFSQTTPVASHYKHVRLNMDGHGPYTRALVLLHPIYGGVELANNYVVGHVVARRGSVTGANRLDIAYINSSSAYRTIAANVVSHNTTDHPWVLKTCTYNGIKYIALDVPYANPQHSQGIEFAGWALSSGESEGLSLGEMNKLLLKKVEELTLHLINKDKMLDEILSRLDKLEAGGDVQVAGDTQITSAMNGIPSCR